MNCWAGIVLAGACLLSAEKPSPAPQAESKSFELVRLRGEVVPYRPELEGILGTKLAGREADSLLALRAQDGRLHLLLPTTSARLFYLDPQMHHRHVQITARVHNKVQGVQVIDVHTIKEGKLHEVYYWCGICAIKSYARLPCECCQEPVELREVPLPAGQSD
jgi:hypothetical protein